MSNIRFSIMMPVYNVEKYITKSIESVLNQSYDNWSLIIVDDGSTDSSGIIADDFAKKDSRIDVYHKKNEGLLKTRRFALTKAKGDYLIFLDSDDFLEPNMLSVISEKITTYNCDLLIFGFQRVNDDGEVLYKSSINCEDDICITNKKSLYTKVYCSSEYNPLCRKAVKHELYLEKDFSEFYGLSLGEDLLQSSEFYANSSKTLIIKDVLYNYRMNNLSISNNYTLNSIIVNYDIRQYITDLILNCSFLSEKDRERYFQYCLEIISGDIKKILSVRGKQSEKRILLKKIYDSYFYKICIQNYKGSPVYWKNKIIFRLFKNKAYNLLILIGNIC